MPETLFLSLQYANVILLQGEGQHGEDSDQIPGENGMIYITGDTHGDFARFSTKRLRRTGMELTKEDYIIICGDFGLCWAKDKTFEYHCKNFAEKPYTILWVQGNHENYDMIGEYPLEEWHGGKARHIILDKVILLERGQVFEIDGKTFLPDPSGKLVAPGAADRGRTAGGPAQSGTISLRGRLCDHTLLCQHVAGPDQCRDGTLLCPGSADGLSGDFGTEAALQALVFRPLSPGLSAG